MLKQTKITDYFKPIKTIKEIQEDINFEYLHNRCLEIKENSPSRIHYPIQHNIRILAEYILAIGDKLKNT